MPTTTETRDDLLRAGFHALSDSLRFQVINVLRSREYCVCDLCELLSVSQSKLSFHLKALKEAEIITPRQEGRWVYYKLNRSRIHVLENYLQEIRESVQAEDSAPPCCE